MEDKLSLSTMLKEAELFRLPKFFLAGFWVRLFAYLIDIVLINALSAILLNLTLYRLFGVQLEGSFVVKLIELIIYISYFYFLTKHFKSQTPGKILFGIQVVPLKGKANNIFFLIREVFGRAIIYLFPPIAVIMVFSYKNQHLIDMLVDSVVIQKERIHDLREYLESEAATNYENRRQGKIQTHQG